MHDVLNYDGGTIVKITPSMRHHTVLYIPKYICLRIISEFLDKLCGSKNGDETSTDSISAMSFSHSEK
jgi:hypothetical protein